MEYSIYKPGNEKLSLYGYSGNSVLKPRAFYHTGFEDSLEKIVLKEEPEQERSIVDKVFSDKSRTLKATIKAFFNEIMTRENLDSILLSKIDNNICRQHSYLESLKLMNRHSYSLNLLGDFHKNKLHLEGNVLELEKEKRRENLECWKDLMFLKKYLLTALKDYWNTGSRKTFLNIENDNKHRGYMQETEAYNWG